jgi:adenylate cyclase
MGGGWIGEIVPGRPPSSDRLLSTRILGNYEQGLKCAADALSHHPDYVTALRITMACHAMLGNMEAAQKLWPQVALLSPSDRVSKMRKGAPFRRGQDLAKLQEAYRLAGMPE